MDRVEKLEGKNRQLQEQVLELQQRQEKHHLLFRQIADFSSILGVSIELSEVYHNCLKLFKDLLALDFTTLFLVTESPGTLMIHDTLGFSREMVGTFTVCRGVGLPGIVLESERIEVVDDFQTEKRFSIPDVIPQNNITSAIAVPMMHNGKLFGVIIGHTCTKKIFSGDEKSLAQILGNQSATTIKNATHIQSLRVSEQKLVQRTNEFETIFSNSMAGIMLLKGGRVLARCNQRLADFMGYATPEELQGADMRQFHLTEERFQEFGVRYYEALISKEPLTVEYQLCKKDGEPLWCVLSGKAIDTKSPPDLKKGVVWVVEDISQRKQMEEQLLESQKLQSIEILTGGLAHDFNNIITAILGNISLGMASIDQENPAYPYLLPAKEASLRAKELTQKLQQFSKETAPVCSVASLDEIIIETVDSVVTDSTICVEYRFSEDLWRAKIDDEQIRKALTHLLENSQQAMPDGGSIYISCSNFPNNGEIAALKAEYFVQVKITDTGLGIPEDIIDNIFDPYFTTKNRDSNQGSGLGLATVHSVIKRHKGFISVASVENSGTTFTFYLVASPPEGEIVETVVDEEESPSVVSKKGRVLVMDDEESIRDIIAQMLTLGGYEVVLVGNGEEAIQLYGERLNTGKQFDVAILDLNIPNGMGGVDTARELTLLHKKSKVIASSGDNADPVMEKFAEYGFAGVINKPFDFTDLLRTVASVVSAS